MVRKNSKNKKNRSRNSISNIMPEIDLDKIKIPKIISIKDTKKKNWKFLQ